MLASVVLSKLTSEKEFTVVRVFIGHSNDDTIDRAARHLHGLRKDIRGDRYLWKQVDFIPVTEVPINIPVNAIPKEATP